MEIVSIRNKVGSPLEVDNWRHKLFGVVTLCWIAGGFYQRSAYFLGKIRMEEGKPVELNLHRRFWCSTTTSQPVEIEPGVFDFQINTSIYGSDSVMVSDEEGYSCADFPFRWFTCPGELEIYDWDDTVESVIFHNTSCGAIKIDGICTLAPGESKELKHNE